MAYGVLLILIICIPSQLQYKSVPLTTWEVGLTMTSASGRKFKILIVRPSLPWPGGEMSESGGNADMELSDRMF